MADYKTAFAAAKALNKDLSDSEINEGLAAHGVEIPKGFMDTVRSTVKEGLAAAEPMRTSGQKVLQATVPVGPLGLGTALTAPFTGTAGDAAATAASVAANIATGGRAGYANSAARVAAPVVAGALGDYQSGNDHPWVSAFLRGGGALGAEGIAKVASLVKAFRGSQLQQADMERVTGAINDATGHVRPVQPNALDIVSAGAGKPAMGNPTASGSLEAAISNRATQTYDLVAQTVGERVRFQLPGGGQGSLRQALDAYAGLREGAQIPGAVPGGEKAQAERLFQHITEHLTNNGLAPQAHVLEAARRVQAAGMSAQRLIEHAATGTTTASKPLEPIINPERQLDMPALQRRYLSLKEAGVIDASVQPQLEAAMFPGGHQPGQPLTDIPGKLPLHIRPRVSASGGFSVADNLGELLSSRVPQYVGGPQRTAPVGPVQGLPRQLLSVGGVLGANAAGNSLKERLQNAPTP